MVHLPRTFLLCRIAALALLTSVIMAAAASTAAQSWPNRPLTMVIPYAPGGSTDLIARLVAPRLAAELGQPILLENMAGVGGIAGVSRVAKAAAPKPAAPHDGNSLPIRRMMHPWSSCPPPC